MTVTQLIGFIRENPTVLKRPIILNDYELQVGYNVDDITIFLPEEYREQECLFCVPEEECEYRKHLEIID